MYQKWKDRARIYIVYILEAHPTDGRRSKENDREGIRVTQPKTYEERAAIAGTCLRELKLTIPMLVDDMNNTAQKAYAGWPERLYVVDGDGKIAYRGQGAGPRAFRPDEVETVLENLTKGK